MDANKLDSIELKATLETRKSKNGNDYTVAVIHITPNCKKQVFLEQSELELLSILYSKSQK